MNEKTNVKQLPARSEINVEDTWRLEDIFATDDDWEKEFAAVQEMIPGIEKFKGRLGESADTFYEALQYEDQLLERMGKLYTYAHMRYDQDTTNSFYQAMDARRKILYAQVASALSFIVPEILSHRRRKNSSIFTGKERTAII